MSGVANAVGESTVAQAVVQRIVKVSRALVNIDSSDFSRMLLTIFLHILRYLP